MAGDLERSREARTLAEEALVRLVVAAGPDAQRLVVIGGLTPDVHADPNAPKHMGTIDVDVLLEVGFVYDRDELDFAWLERALVQSSFRPYNAGNGWRWRISISDVPVILDLLCDAFDNQHQEIALPGTSEVTAMNLAGPAPAAVDVVRRSLPVPSDLQDDGVPAYIDVRFTGLGGYLLAKAAAAVGRKKDKDFYDFAYMVAYNDQGGPVGAAHAVSTVVGSRAWLTRNPEIDLAELTLNFSTPESPGPMAFAREMIRAGSALDANVLAQDAVSAVLLFERARSLAR